MSDQAHPHAAPAAGPRQEQPGFRTREDWEELLGYAGQLIESLEQIEDEALRAQVFECLQAVDAVHREAVTRLVRLFKDGVLEQVIADPAIRTLMEMYDLLPAASPCAKVYDFLSAAEAPGERGRIGERKVLARVPIPHWVPVPKPAAELGSGEVEVHRLDERDVLIARVESAVFALAGRCLCDGRRMDDAARHGYTLCCPGPNGCLYDLRSGARVGAGGQLEGFAANVDDQGRVLVGFGMPFVPKLPTF
jgi:nitrite reductase/ring-hydroxylating ferredoxin subunit